MRFILGVFTAALFALTLAGCSKSDPHDDVARESVDVMKELTTELKTVTDESSFKTAEPKLKRLSERMEQLKAKQSQLPKLSAEDEAALKAKYEKELEPLVGDMMKEAMRLMLDPKLGPLVEKAGLGGRATTGAE